jgi:hypothetical protein
MIKQSSTSKQKRATTSNRLTKLAAFAKRHDLSVRSTKVADSESGKQHVFAHIGFGTNEPTAAISDPLHDHGIKVTARSAAALKRAIKQSGLKRPLCLTLYTGHQNNLYEEIGFDVPAHEDRGDRRDSNWGPVLEKLGIVRLFEDDTAAAFLFGSNDSAAVPLVLALACIE